MQIPGEICRRAKRGKFGFGLGAFQEQASSSRTKLIGQKRQQPVQRCQRTRCDYGRLQAGQGLNTIIMNRRCQTAFANYRAEEDGFLLILFYKMTISISQDCQHQARKPGPAANINKARRSIWNIGCQLR